MQSLPSSKHNQQETHNMYILWNDTTVPESSCFCFVMNPCIPYTYVLRPWLAKQLSCCVSCPAKYMNCSTRKWNHHLEISVSLEFEKDHIFKWIFNQTSTLQHVTNMLQQRCFSWLFYTIVVFPFPGCQPIIGGRSTGPPSLLVIAKVIMTSLEIVFIISVGVILHWCLWNGDGNWRLKQGFPSFVC